MKKEPRGRIEARGDEISAVSDELLLQRAKDLAREDGRTEPRDADFKKAREELSGFTEDSAPEVPPGDENLTSSDDSADTVGHKVDTSPPDQDVDVGLELVEEGVDEADLDQRRAAADDNLLETD
ncbi:MAG TPA: hypothetical protein VGH06_02710 [Candidatus Udaeobacter sp.]|jgi:hypothetical protein